MGSGGAAPGGDIADAAGRGGGDLRRGGHHLGPLRARPPRWPGSSDRWRARDPTSWRSWSAGWSASPARDGSAWAGPRSSASRRRTRRRRRSRSPRSTAPSRWSRRTTGAGSAAARDALLHGLLERATAPEADFLRRLLTGELRQGALEGVMAEAVARAAEVPAGAVRRAVHAVGRPRRWWPAPRWWTGRPASSGSASRCCGRCQPMLASTASLGGRRARRHGRAGVGRVEARRRAHPGPPPSGRDVRLYTRNLNDVTDPPPRGRGARAGACRSRRSCSTARSSA